MVEGFSDEKLILRYRDGDEQAAELLIEKYKPVVRMRAREFYLTGGDQEDLLQEGMLGLFKAIRKYDGTKGASFATFAQLLISRQMYAAIAFDQRKKHSLLNSSISINALEELHKEDQIGTVDSPENIILEDYTARELRKEIEAKLSPLEKKVLDLYLEGEDYRQIAAILDRPPKSVDNALQRIRAKAHEVYWHGR